MRCGGHPADPRRTPTWAWWTSGLSGWLRSGLVSYRFASVLLPCSHGFPMLLTWILYGGHSRQMPLRVGGHQWRTMARRTSADIGRTSADIGRKSLIKRTVGFGKPSYGRAIWSGQMADHMAAHKGGHMAGRMACQTPFGALRRAFGGNALWLNTLSVKNYQTKIIK